MCAFPARHQACTADLAPLEHGEARTSQHQDEGGDTQRQEEKMYKHNQIMIEINVIYFFIFSKHYSYRFYSYEKHHCFDSMVLLIIAIKG